jgi:hypothetical protein
MAYISYVATGTRIARATAQVFPLLSFSRIFQTRDEEHGNYETSPQGARTGLEILHAPFHRGAELLSSDFGGCAHEKGHNP